ncbi:hypothetical protein ACFY4C_40530 [Actinomadura viridis]
MLLTDSSADDAAVLIRVPTDAGGLLIEVVNRGQQVASLTLEKVGG